MEQTFNPCDECEYSYLRQNQESGMCKICEFKKILRLEEQGKLLKLPCAFGDNVFVAMKSGGYAQAEVKDFTYFHTCGFCIVAASDKFGKCNIPFSEFGKTVFLTLEEAEAALKEMSE